MSETDYEKYRGTKVPVLVPDHNSASGHRVEWLSIEIGSELAKLLDSVEIPAALAATPAASPFCRGGVNPGWDECPKCGATSDECCLAATPAMSHLENAKALLDEWMGMFDPAPGVDGQQFEMLQHGIATALMSKDEIADAAYPDRNAAATPAVGGEALRKQIAEINVDDDKHPEGNLQYVIIRGFSAMGWSQPTLASNEMLDAIVALSTAGEK